MVAPIVCILLAAAPLTPQELEQQAARSMQEQSSQRDPASPVLDAVLTRAARRIARQALSSPAAHAPDTQMASDAVSEEGGADLVTSSVVLRAGVPGHVLELLHEKKEELRGTEGTLLGVGVAAADSNVALVILKANRWVRLKPLPRAFPASDDSQLLCGDLLPPLREPSVHVTRPDGAVERVSLTRPEPPPDRGQVQGLGFMSRRAPPVPGDNRSFCAELRFPQPGVHTVAVSAGRGTQLNMGGVFRVRVGEPGLESAEPATVTQARVALLARINALREAEGLAKVGRDTLVERVAQAYADRMVREGFFGPQAPDGTTARDRLPDDNPTCEYLPENASPWVRQRLEKKRNCDILQSDPKWGGQNLGWGTGPLSAHFGIENTSEARRNLLDPEMHYLGIGVAWRQVEGRREALVVEVLTRRRLDSGVGNVTPTDIAYMLLARMRPPGLSALKRSPALDQLAVTVARAAQAPGEVTDPAVHEHALKTVPGLQSVAMEVYAVDDPLGLPRSAALKDATTTHLGVGVVETGGPPGSGAPAYRVGILYAKVAPL
ncbi:CAP domain-containing protein [Pyxidicoccus sp. 3LG]